MGSPRPIAVVPDNWVDADPEHLHDLRRRVVEHRHQMDLVEPLWPRLGKVWAEEAQRCVVGSALARTLQCSPNSPPHINLLRLGDRDCGR